MQSSRIDRTLFIQIIQCVQTAGEVSDRSMIPYRSAKTVSLQQIVPSSTEGGQTEDEFGHDVKKRGSLLKDIRVSQIVTQAVGLHARRTVSHLSSL